MALANPILAGPQYDDDELLNELDELDALELEKDLVQVKPLKQGMSANLVLKVIANIITSSPTFGKRKTCAY